MKRNISVLCIGVAALLLTACSEKKQDHTIITTKPVAKVQDVVKAMGNNSQNRDANWLGANYKVQVVRQSDKSLAKVSLEDGTQYYDNSITVKVFRADGSQFFGKTFTKKNFESFIDEKTKKRGCLLGVVFVKAESDNLLFAASVGSPDETSDEYIPLVVKVSRMGAVSISKDTLLGTEGGAAEDEDEAV